jgi:hypothetical protein
MKSSPQGKRGGRPQGHRAPLDGFGARGWGWLWLRTPVLVVLAGSRYFSQDEFGTSAVYEAAGGRGMLYLITKARISGVLIAVASEVARRHAGIGALIASLPLISVLGITWLWRNTQDPLRVADHAAATLWYAIPSFPMFVVIPLMLRARVSFWAVLVVGCVLTVTLYGAVMWVMARA